MRASAIEFRLRMAINAVIIILGFWAPWIEYWGIGRRVSTVEWLALELSRSGLASFAVATAVLVTIAVLMAAVSAVFRVWGTAYPGPSTVNSVQMVAGRVMADGPYRFVRNPLYIGMWCMAAAMAFLMPVTGALFAIVLITVFMVRLTLVEEAFLKGELGEPYEAYRRVVPRFLVRLRGVPPAAGTKPHWVRAIFAELTPIGILISLIVYARNYEEMLATRVILIFFGASLVVRALMPGARVTSETAK